MKCGMATTNARTKEKKQLNDNTNSKIQLFLLRYYNIFILLNCRICAQFGNH